MMPTDDRQDLGWECLTATIKLSGLSCNAAGYMLRLLVLLLCGFGFDYLGMACVNLRMACVNLGLDEWLV